MSYWYYMACTVSGPEAEIERFKQACLVPDSPGAIDLQRIVPSFKTPTREARYYVEDGLHKLSFETKWVPLHAVLGIVIDMFPALSSLDIAAGCIEFGVFYKGTISASGTDLSEDKKAMKNWEMAMGEARNIEIPHGHHNRPEYPHWPPHPEQAADLIEATADSAGGTTMLPLITQPKETEPLTDEPEDVNVFPVGPTALSPARDDAPLLERVLNAQGAMIKEKYGEKAAEVANYGWYSDFGDDDAVVVVTKVYVDPTMALHSQCKRPFSEITHEWHRV
jgi:hypothetical protein